jgi:AcrR family transcriptional regulator
MHIVSASDASKPAGASAVSTARGRDILDASLTLFAERGYLGTSMKDIAALLGIRAPSLYNHLDSKQDLLREIMVSTMETLIAEHEAAVATTDDVAEQLRRAMEAHVRYHARHRRDVRIGNAEVWHLEEPWRTRVLELRHRYTKLWQGVIERGVELGRFDAPSPQLATYAMLQMGIGVSAWFREDGPLSEAQIAYYYGDMALRVVSVVSADVPAVLPRE